MAVPWVLPRARSLSALALSLLWALAASGKDGMVWMWTDKAVLEIRLSLTTASAQGVVADWYKHFVSLQTSQATLQALRKLAERPVALKTGGELLCQAGIFDEGSWRLAFTSSLIMLVCGGLTSVCLFVAAVFGTFRDDLERVHKLFSPQRIGIAIWVCLFVGPFLSMLGVLQYVVFTCPLAIETEARLGNGFAEGCALAFLTAIPAYLQRLIEKKEGSFVESESTGVYGSYWARPSVDARTIQMRDMASFSSEAGGQAAAAARGLDARGSMVQPHRKTAGSVLPFARASVWAPHPAAGGSAEEGQPRRKTGHWGEAQPHQETGGWAEPQGWAEVQPRRKTGHWVEARPWCETGGWAEVQPRRKTTGRAEFVPGPDAGGGVQWQAGHGVGQGPHGNAGGYQGGWRPGAFGSQAAPSFAGPVPGHFAGGSAAGGQPGVGHNGRWEGASTGAARPSFFQAWEGSNPFAA